MPKAVMRASFALTASLLFLAPLLFVTPTTAAVAPDAEALGRALGFLAAKRDDATPFRGTQITTVVEGLAYANVDPKIWPSPGRNTFDLLSPYPSSNGYYYSHLRIAYAAAISGYDPRAVHGVDYVQKVRDGYVAAQFGNVSFNNDDVWAVLALRAAGVPATDPMIQQAVQNIHAARALDGGWSHTAVATASDVDSTGMALLALANAGVDISGDTQARAFLTNMQSANGGFQPKKNLDPTCQSTVWAIHGLKALGQVPPPSAFAFIRKLHNADGGFGPTLDKDQNPTASDTFCTVEVLAILAGTLAPRLSFKPVHIEGESALRAGAPTTLRVDAEFADVVWNVSGTRFDGNSARVTFAKQGTYPVDVDARAGNLRGRYHGTLEVVGSAPTLTFEPIPSNTLRHTPVVVDARASTDVDGTLSRLQVDWGDGNTTSAASLVATHTYANPAQRAIVIRLIDNDGRQTEATHAIMVSNRAPTFAAWTDGATLNRTQSHLVLPMVSDADGDAISVRWTLGNETDITLGVPLPAQLGPSTVRVEARDPYGGQAWANVTFEVVNLAPTLANLSLPADARAGETFAFAVDARDADGPAPSVVWNIGNHTKEITSGTLVLDAGTWNVSVTATDADAASTRLARTLVVRDAKGASPTVNLDAQHANTSSGTAPRVENLAASFQDGMLDVTFDATPEGATRTIRWQTDVAQGTTTVTGGKWRMPLQYGHWARVSVEAAWAGERASAESAIVHAPPSPALGAPELTATPNPPTAGAPVTLSIEAETPLRRVRIDTGDGTTLFTNESLAAHTYAASGTYVLSLFVESTDGRTAQRTLSLVVAPAPEPLAASRDAEPTTVVRLADAADEPFADDDVQRETIAQAPAARRIPLPSLLLVLAMCGLAAIVRGKRRA